LARVVGLVAVAVHLVALPAWAAPGDLDPTFSEDGVAVAAFPEHYGVARDVAVQFDGRIVAVGAMHVDMGIASDFALVRYTFAGNLDPNFGRGGRILTDFGGRYDEAEAVAVQEDRKIVVVGDSTDDIAVARYSATGHLDRTFEGDGRTLIDLGGSETALDVAIQPDGRIVLVGTDGPDFFVVRLLADGSLDPEFGVGGSVRTDFRGSQDTALAVAIQQDGMIVVGGFCVTGTRDDFALARYLPDGSLDQGFGTGGLVRTDFAGWEDRITDLVVQTDGKIAASGEASQYPGGADQRSDVGVARYLPDGQLDPTFGHSGKVRTDFGSYFDEAQGMAVLADGRIVVASPFFDVDHSVAAVARYQVDGHLDPSFGSGGIARTTVETSSDQVGGLTLIGDERISVVAGTSPTPGDFAFLALRFLSA
jgi:uncharacterized delta-60 repeat protein